MYASSTFVTLVEETNYGGRSIKKSTGKEYFRAANPQSVNLKPMSAIGSCTIPLAFPPLERVYEAKAGIVNNPPYSIVLGRAFMKDNWSIIGLSQLKGLNRPQRSCGYHLFAALD